MQQKGGGKMADITMLREKISESGMTITAIANKTGILRNIIQQNGWQRRFYSF